MRVQLVGPSQRILPTCGYYHLGRALALMLWNAQPLYQFRIVVGLARFRNILAVVRVIGEESRLAVHLSTLINLRHF